ncbi:MAG: GNAT family N-acetyltransferase [Armatimonadetes bacterium]|nr:GNAT family N-acetyltransferase [Armatimonadota bacterium]
MPVRLQRIDDSNRTLFERLLQFYGHDLSEFEEHEPDFDGSFCDGARAKAYSDGSADVQIISIKGKPAGFIVCSVADGPRHSTVLDVFVLRCYRRLGIGSLAVETVLEGREGPWTAEFSADNRPALKFWRSFLTKSGFRSVRELTQDEGRSVRIEFDTRERSS